MIAGSRATQRMAKEVDGHGGCLTILTAPQHLACSRQGWQTAIHTWMSALANLSLEGPAGSQSSTMYSTRCRDMCHARKGCLKNAVACIHSQMGSARCGARGTLQKAEQRARSKRLAGRLDGPGRQGAEPELPLQASGRGC